MITFKIYSKVIGLAVAALTLAACADTWDDHYDKKGEARTMLRSGRPLHRTVI